MGKGTGRREEDSVAATERMMGRTWVELRLESFCVHPKNSGKPLKSFKQRR